MTKILSRTAIQRMVGVAGGSSAAAGGGTGGGGGGSVDLTGYATEEWVNENYLSIEFFSSLFKAYDSAATPNEIEPNDGDTTAITNIKAMFGFWTEQYLSALGLNSAGGGGGDVSSLDDLQDVNLSSPTNGQALVYNATSGKWENQTIGGGSTGTLSSVGLVMPEGFSVSPGTLTADGSFTVGFSSGYALPLVSDVNKGVAAYGWGNHANAGYLTSVSFSQILNTPTTLAGYGINDAYISNGSIVLGTNTITPWTNSNHPSTLAGYGISDAKFGTATTDYVPITLGSTTQNVLLSNALNGFATQSWVNQQGFLTSSALNGYATESWVNQQGFLTSSDLNGYATELWVGNNYLPLTGGTLTGDLRLKNSSNYGMHLYFGDGSYCYLHEDTDDHLVIHAAKGVKFDLGTNYNATIGNDIIATQPWVSSNYPGTVTSVGMSVPAGFAISGSPITSSGTLALSFATGYSLPLTADVAKGVTANGWGNHAEAGYWKDGTGNHPTTLSGYGITDALGSNTTFWGQTASNGAVSGSMTDVGSIAATGEIKTSSANAFRLSYNNAYGVILRNDATNFRMLLTDSGSADSGTWNTLRPFTVGLSSGLVSMENGLHIMNANRNVNDPNGFNALRIGDGVLMWDSTNNAIKVIKSDGSAVNFYATGGVSALGFTNNQGTSMQINNLTISEKIHFDNGVDDNTIYTYDSGMLYIEANEGVQFFADIYSNNELFMLGHDIKLGGGKIYFDNSKYLYISNMSLYFYDGTQHIKIT